MTPTEAAEYARVKESTVRGWISDGLISPAITKQKKNPSGSGAAGYVIDSRDIDLLLERLKQDVSTYKEPGRANLDRRINRSRNPRSST